MPLARSPNPRPATGPVSHRLLRGRLAWPLLWGLVLACGTGTGGDDPAAPSAEPVGRVSTVILISIDTLRADRLAFSAPDPNGPKASDSALPGPQPDTPHLDVLARESLRFRNAWSHVPLTLPSHATVFTGRLPAEIGVRDNVGYRLDPATPTLASLLAAAGWATAGGVSAAPLDARTGIGVGFDRWEDRLHAELGSGLGEVQRSGHETLAAIRPWLDDAGENERNFLFFHLFEPHTPYEPPPEIERRWGRTYEAEVVAADAVVGALRAELETRGLWRDALVILFSDHGEGLGDHGEDEHGVLLYREALHVPLLVKLPERLSSGAAPPADVDHLVQLSDIFPTVLRLAGVADPRPTASGTRSPGSSTRARALFDERGRLLPPGERAVLAETFYPRIHFGWSELLSLVRGEHQYIHGPAPELYHLGRDPRQRHDLRASERRLVHRLRREVLAHDLAWNAPSVLGEEERAQLEALGYLGSSVIGAEAGLEDPKTQLAALRTLKRGATAYRQREYEAAVEWLEPLLAAHPRMTDGWAVLGHSLYNLGRADAALRAYSRHLELSGPSPAVAAPAARLLVADGQVSAALALLRSQLDAVPSSTRLRRLEARLRIESGDLASARERLDDWLAFDPDSAEALYQRGIVHLLAGDEAAAEADLRSCLARAPDFAAALHDLGVLLARTDRDTEARALVERALAADPDHPLAAETLARLP